MTVPKKATIDHFVQLRHGFTPQNRASIGAIYIDAFGPKLGRIFGQDARSQRFVTACLNPEFAIVAHDPITQQVIAVAGYKTERGGLTSDFSTKLRTHYGRFGGYWRGTILEMLQTVEGADKVLIDGIAVAPPYRGRGVGTALLHALEQTAHDLGKRGLRLDVIEGNTRARALYARHGYEESATHDLGLLRHAFGFRRATQMTKML